MNIAGVLVHAYPGKHTTVRATLEELPGVELHHETPDGRFIVTVEDEADVSCDTTIMNLQRMPGIAAATLAYHNFETENPTPIADVRNDRMPNQGA